MAQKKRSAQPDIPGWLIFVGFLIGFWPGMILLVIRLLSEVRGGKTSPRRQPQSMDWTPDIEWSPDGTYHSRTQTRNSAGETVRKDGASVRSRRTYEPPKAGAAQQGAVHVHPQTRSAQEMARKKLSPKTGRGLWIAGIVLLVLGTMVGLQCIMDGIRFGDSVFYILSEMTMTGGVLAGPGAAMLIAGISRRKRVLRCRTYASMIGRSRCIEISKLASAVDVKYNKCCDDLNWMLSVGFYPGMYIDAGLRCLTYPDAAPEKPRRTRKPKAKPPVQEADGAFPEEKEIRKINDQIRDEQVSEKMDRLEELTHKILDYAGEHPEKEESLRQFRTYYLPQTMHILEAYARMERTGVAGSNISAAMNDVEKIMDKLVAGFEKQLDALYDSEAMDVMADVTVLENMMGASGLSDLDPFGAGKLKDEEEKLG